LRWGKKAHYTLVSLLELGNVAATVARKGERLQKKTGRLDFRGGGNNLHKQPAAVHGQVSKVGGEKEAFIAYKHSAGRKFGILW